MSGERLPTLRTAISAALVGGTVLGVGLGLAYVVLSRRPAPPWAELGLYAIVMSVVPVAIWLVLRTARPPANADAEVAVAGTRLDRFQVDTRGTRRVVRAEDVLWIEAAGNYARLHLADDSFLYRLPLARLEAELPDNFLRVHRSGIVNLDALRRVAPLPSGDAELHLAGGRLVSLSRRYAKSFHARTGRAAP